MSKVFDANSRKRLLSQPAPFDFETLIAETPLEAIYYCHELSSTNDTAMALLRDWSVPPDLPGIVLTQRQLSGKGRGNHQWESSSGNLTFSILVDSGATDGIPVSLLSLITGLGVCQSLEEIAPNAHVQLKWPNDVFVGGKKIAGILIESTAAGRVIGIGLNVNHSVSVDGSTSLVQETGAEIGLQSVLQQLISRWFEVLAIAQADPERLIDECGKRMLFWGRTIQFEVSGETKMGRWIGLGAGGEMRLEMGGETKLVVSAHHIRLAE